MNTSGTNSLWWSFCSGYPESWSLKLNLLLLGLSVQTAMLWNCDLEVSPESKEIKKSSSANPPLHSLIWVKWPSFTFPKACAAYYCNIMLFWKHLFPDTTLATSLQVWIYIKTKSYILQHLLVIITYENLIHSNSRCSLGIYRNSRRTMWIAQNWFKNCHQGSVKYWVLNTYNFNFSPHG